MRTKEKLLQHIWKYRLYLPETLVNTAGETVHILDVGIHNTHAGPDFFNAKIRIGSQVWAGNVEVHSQSSDWYAHKHHEDPGFNSVILHVVGEVNEAYIQTQNQRLVPQLQLPVLQHIQDNYQDIVDSANELACSTRIAEVLPLDWLSWMARLTAERLETKQQRIVQLLEQYTGDWEEVFYLTMARSLGFGVNSDAFERLAKSLPLRYLYKHQDNLLQLEAFLFGQAGQLSGEEENDPYYRSLQAEYRFLKNKFNLQPLEGHLFKRLRVRPSNSPHVRLAQLAAILHGKEHFFARLLGAENPSDYETLFTPEVSDYWKTHFYLQLPSVDKPKLLSTASQRVLLINTVVPILFAYGKQKKKEEWVEKALQLLEYLPPEKNSVVSLFTQGGVQVNNAADTQALIQLKKEYCEQKKCLFCRIGHKLLSRSKD